MSHILKLEAEVPHRLYAPRPQTSTPGLPEHCLPRCPASAGRAPIPGSAAAAPPCAQCFQAWDKLVLAVAVGLWVALRNLRVEVPVQVDAGGVGDL